MSLHSKVVQNVYSERAARAHLDRTTIPLAHKRAMLARVRTGHRVLRELANRDKPHPNPLRVGLAGGRVVTTRKFGEFSSPEVTAFILQQFIKGFRRALGALLKILSLVDKGVKPHAKEKGVFAFVKSMTAHTVAAAARGIKTIGNMGLDFLTWVANDPMFAAAVMVAIQELLRPLCREISIYIGMVEFSRNRTGLVDQLTDTLGSAASIGTSVIKLAFQKWVLNGGVSKALGPFVSSIGVVLSTFGVVTGGVGTALTVALSTFVNSYAIPAMESILQDMVFRRALKTGLGFDLIDMLRSGCLQQQRVTISEGSERGIPALQVIKRNREKNNIPLNEDILPEEKAWAEKLIALAEAKASNANPSEQDAANEAEETSRKQMTKARDKVKNAARAEVRDTAAEVMWNPGLLPVVAASKVMDALS